MTTIGLGQIAWTLSVTPRRVQQLVAEGMPQISQNEFDLRSCVAWYIRALEAEESGEAAPTAARTAQRIWMASVRTEQIEVAYRTRGSSMPLTKPEQNRRIRARRKIPGRNWVTAWRR